jgi:hypothetical protein
MANTLRIKMSYQVLSAVLDCFGLFALRIFLLVLLLQFFAVATIKGNVDDAYDEQDQSRDPRQYFRKL